MSVKLENHVSNFIKALIAISPSRNRLTQFLYIIYKNGSLEYDVAYVSFPEIMKNDEKQNIIEETYNQIIEILAKYIEELRKKPDYYHNKFFKNEKSIGLVRNHFKKKYSFFEVIS